MEIVAMYGIMFLIYIPFLAIAIVCLVLAIKLMNRGIKALDKYILENS